MELGGVIGAIHWAEGFHLLCPVVDFGVIFHEERHVEGAKVGVYDGDNAGEDGFRVSIAAAIRGGEASAALIAFVEIDFVGVIIGVHPYAAEHEDGGFGAPVGYFGAGLVGGGAVGPIEGVELFWGEGGGGVFFHKSTFQKPMKPVFRVLFTGAGIRVSLSEMGIGAYSPTCEGRGFFICFFFDGFSAKFFVGAN